MSQTALTTLFPALPAFLMAVLACWLGLSLLVRAPRDRPAQAFAWLCLHLTLYGLAVFLPALSRSPLARQAFELAQVIETVLLPPVFFHFILVLVADGPPPRWQKLLLALFYAVGLAMAAYALAGPMRTAPNGGLRFPSGWVVPWTAQRALPMLAALALMWLSYRRAVDDDLERRRRALFALSAVVGVVGALWATVARNLGFAPSFGHLLMDAALALLAYAVLAYRSLLPARVVQRTFYRSLLGGLLTALYVALLLLAEPFASQVIQPRLQIPLVTIFTLIGLIAVFGPLRDWAGALIDRRFFHREFDYARLLRELSDDWNQRGDLAGQLQAALTAICRTLGLRHGAVAVQEGTGLRLLAAYGDPPDAAALREVRVPDAPQTHYGDWAAWPAARLLLPLARAGNTYGLLLLGAKRSGEPFREAERALLRLLGDYLARTIKLIRAQQEEEVTLAALAEQSRQLLAEQELLEAQALEALRLAAQPAPVPQDGAGGLRVFALGPLRVERDGRPIERWGGDKAGTYQAEALFAFLFDRRGRGLTKDEAEEVIWPDLDLDKADTAFHRTVAGLRRTLEPGLRRGNESKLIAYHHERYWFDPAAVAWCDADAFAVAAERGHTQLRQGNLEGARAALAEAAELYRGDYMDDCPFFGDSTYVEARRAELRDQYVDALLALGACYERLAQPGEAATCYRRALAAAAGDCPRAEEALERLQGAA
ncbi:BTAD domain-containing putative transcriptional regulator [Kouleothrix sp.]|uniref:BTAD domain-containing putative transcriptional regulator n=1 Tax=Kouleothrix sp. TaxID=2779161 RepID=UPI0039195C78